VRILRVETLVARGPFSKSPEWHQTREALHRAIRRVVWPPGSKNFTIYPQSGKKRGEGNGVKPIKDGLMLQLKDLGWDLEVPLEISSPHRPGNLDAVIHTLHGPAAVEWETGNISSSHRALNKMTLGLLKGKLACGTLIVPLGSSTSSSRTELAISRSWSPTWTFGVRFRTRRAFWKLSKWNTMRKASKCPESQRARMAGHCDDAGQPST